MLSARPEVSREVTAISAALRLDTRKGAGLAVVPEGELLNYLSGRPNPIRHKLYVPGYLTDADQRDVLGELAEEPAAVVVWNWPTGEYGRGLFGEDYGVHVAHWIEREYTVRPFVVAGAPQRKYPRFRYGTRRKSPMGGARAGL